MGIISSKYPGRCKSCKTAIRPGDRVFWTKGVKGVTCLTCHGNSKPAPSPTPETKPTAVKPRTKKTREKKPARFVIEWAELKAQTKRILAGDLSDYPTNSAAKNQADRAVNLARGESWHGYTKGQLERWITKGYDAEAIRSLQEMTPPIREKRKLRFNEEEGEIHLDLAWSGADSYFSEWTKTERIPGAAVEVHFAVHAGIKAEVINAFNAWACRAFYSLESSGVDCEISYVYTSRGLFDWETVRETVIRVKRENETTDFLSFSAMLGPAAFRTFMFLANSAYAESCGGGIDEGQGAVADSSHEWSVIWNAERRVIEIYSPWSPSDFPEGKMTEQLREVLHEMKSA